MDKLQFPLPLDQPWPVGARLRFKPDAATEPGNEYLRGTPALVLSALALLAEHGEWRQYATAFGARYPADQFGWALPGQLEPIPGEPELPAAETDATHGHAPAGRRSRVSAGAVEVPASGLSGGAGPD